MAVRVLIVDDSGFFRHRISELLASDPRIEVVGSASNGREGIEQVKKLRPDVVTMDVEMPQMNGIEAVRIIMRDCPTKVMMLSSLTQEGARVTLQALEAGAVDYLSKDMRAWMDRSLSLQKQLCDKIVTIGSQGRALTPFMARSRAKEGQSSTTMVFRPQRSRSSDAAAASASPAPAAQSTVNSRAASTATSTALRRPLGGGAAADLAARSTLRGSQRLAIPRDTRLVVIGSSTGGPAALQEILTQLPASFPYPLLLIQHMPKTFTTVFAERLNQQCQIAVKEAEDGDRLQPGRALLAPGGHQLIVDGKQHDRIRILPGDDRLTYKPSVDVTYGSAAKSYGNRVLAIILTGMGADGSEGARLLKQAGAHVWAQSKDSCTIFGMPQAVIKAGLANEILDLEQIGPILSGGR
ncbi:protein-glutamate methylesterase/protein-glutamine glutaminase [Marinobacterium arenosum]|uniref:protein-glutamate methylesterase/protein-glutamine glutaminase n=1 Tax=Marinobacterium arenosum TaxID=2862496 RepID=UPI001C93A4C8|nr:chemotaxis response regulator protein-glutamate methylesterase [Marinobacterium arenosum]MBY4675966.1 chemotaxis response regulator protein-glutamate methylesterase [Marinobacterium arenosum]